MMLINTVILSTERDCALAPKYQQYWYCTVYQRGFRRRGIDGKGRDDTVVVTRSEGQTAQPSDGGKTCDSMRTGTP